MAQQRSHAVSSRRDNRLIQGLRAWARRHSYSLFSSLGTLLRNRIGTLLTTVVLGIALSLPLGLYLTVTNLAQLDPLVKNLGSVSVFLERDVKQNDVDNLVQTLKAYPEVLQVEAKDPAHALSEFRQSSGFGAAVEALEENPLPWVLIITLDDQSQVDSSLVENLLQRIDRLPAVDFAQYDLKWLERLQALLKLSSASVKVLLVLFAVAVIFVVGNTIRLDIENRRDEIQVMSVVGATESFIRRPFLYAGFWYGLLGGLLALLVLGLAMQYLKNPLNQLISVYQGEFQIQSLTFKSALLVLLGSGLLGLFGAVIALRRHLRGLYPA